MDLVIFLAGVGGGFFLGLLVAGALVARKVEDLQAQLDALRVDS